MSHRNLLITLGVLIMLAPLVGLPHAFLLVLVPLLGFLVIVAAVVKRSAPPASHDQNQAV